MKKEIKEILADDLKALALKFDFVEDTSEDIWFPINSYWSVGFSKLTTDTYSYMVFKLQSRKTGFVVRNIFIRKDFNNESNLYSYSMLCDMLLKGVIKHSATLDNYVDLPYQELEHFLYDHLTDTQQWVLHHALGRL